MQRTIVSTGVFAFVWLLAGSIVVLQGALQYTSIAGTPIDAAKNVKSIAGTAHPRHHNSCKRGASVTASNAWARAVTAGTYSSSYAGIKNAYSEGVGRGALLGGALVAALASSMSVLASLPIVTVAFVAAASIGLIGRDYLSYRKSGMGVEITNTPKMIIGLLFIIIGGNLVGAGSPSLLAIASGAAAIGFFLKSQMQYLWQSSAPAALPYKSTLSNSPSAKRTNITWSTWSRASGSDWLPGQPGQNHWQRGQWHTKVKV